MSRPDIKAIAAMRKAADQRKREGGQAQTVNGHWEKKGDDGYPQMEQAAEKVSIHDVITFPHSEYQIYGVKNWRLNEGKARKALAKMGVEYPYHSEAWNVAFGILEQRVESWLQHNR